MFERSRPRRALRPWSARPGVTEPSQRRHDLRSRTARRAPSHRQM